LTVRTWELGRSRPNRRFIFVSAASRARRHLRIQSLPVRDPRGQALSAEPPGPDLRPVGRGALAGSLAMAATMSLGHRAITAKDRISARYGPRGYPFHVSCRATFPFECPLVPVTRMCRRSSRVGYGYRIGTFGLGMASFPTHHAGEEKVRVPAG